MNDWQFHAYVVTKAAFSQETVISYNGERVRSLLCDREALSNCWLCEAVGFQKPAAGSGKNILFSGQTPQMTSFCGVCLSTIATSKGCECKRQHFANPAFDLNKSKISYVRNSGYQAAPDEMFWCRRYSKNTSCPTVLWCRRSGGGLKHFLSARVSYCLPASGDGPVSQRGLRRR